MNMQEAIRTVTEGRNLSGDDMRSVMQTIMTGKATQSQIGGFLIGLRMKGETVDEIAAAAQVMRDLATRVNVSADNMVDTCGTGGDGASTFNISTAVAFVAAAAGAHVAKHGNRSVSSKSGSADVLETAGVNLDLSPEQVSRCVEEVGVGFLFAPKHHGAMKHAIGPRKEMGVRTVFNILGPLTNPAGAPNQVLGVFSGALVEPLASVLQSLGSRHVMVVHAQDGMDEISIGSPTRVAELKDGSVNVYDIKPEDFGMQQADVASLAVDSAQQSLEVIRSVFAGEAGPAADIVVLNAAAAIYTSGISATYLEGIDIARQMLSNGAAAAKLNQLVEMSNSFS